MSGQQVLCFGVCHGMDCIGYQKGAEHERHFDRVVFGSDDKNCGSTRLVSAHGSLRVKTNITKYHNKTITNIELRL